MNDKHIILLVKRADRLLMEGAPIKEAVDCLKQAGLSAIVNEFKEVEQRLDDLFKQVQNWKKYSETDFRD